MTAHSEDPPTTPRLIEQVHAYDPNPYGKHSDIRRAVRELIDAENARRAVPVEPPGVPPHDCEFTLNPEAGKCDLCELFAAGYERGYRAASTPEVMSTEAPTETP